VELKYRKALGRAVRRLRNQASLTQEELAFEAGLERSYVSLVELAQKDPSFTTLQKIALALNFSMLELFQIYEEELRSTEKELPPRRGRPVPGK
jgi:transcriptional regulator with XRE-family HTH domain